MIRFHCRSGAERDQAHSALIAYMTLIMTWIDTRKIVQVCDQRLTMPNGRPFDEQALKMICVASIDASFMLSYTGQAYLPVGSRTDRWLINSIQPVTRRPLPELA